MDWKNVFNEKGNKITASLIRQAASLCYKFDVINLCGGLPNESTFPVETATFRLKDGITLEFSPEETNNALQYSLSTGIPELVEILKKLLLKHHKPPRWDERMVMVTSGSQEAISKALELIVKKGDYVIFPQYVYSGVLSAVKPITDRFLCIEEDKDGMVPKSLRQQLSKWKPGDPGAPKVLYVILDGNNPTGSVTSEERRREIYKIAQEYNLIIIEDDAYYFLNYQEKPRPSFLSMDVDGRVIHTESFSKIFSSGIRLGWVCASKIFVNKLNHYVQCTSQQASSLSQMLVCKTLKTWGDDGFQQHIKNLQNFYVKQRDAIVAAAEKWLTGLAEWHEPQGGMFIWIKILGIKDSFHLMKTALVHHGVGILAGRFFLPTDADSPYIRVTFSSACPEKINEAFQILAPLIREEIRLTSSGLLNSTRNNISLTDLFNI